MRKSRLPQNLPPCHTPILGMVSESGPGATCGPLLAGLLFWREGIELVRAMRGIAWRGRPWSADGTESGGNNTALKYTGLGLGISVFSAGKKTKDKGWGYTRIAERDGVRLRASCVAQGEEFPGLSFVRGRGLPPLCRKAGPHASNARAFREARLYRSC